MSLSFEDVVIPLEEQLAILKSRVDHKKFQTEINNLSKQVKNMLTKIYSNLKPWQILLIARHVERPTGVDYIKHLITDFTEICGDRCGHDDKALICGIGKFNGSTICVVGHNKGCDLEERVKTNFGMSHPEGYKKVMRLFEISKKFNFPLLAFIDTKGAAADKGSEERGQSYALAQCIKMNFELTAPLISVIVGEGGSGGAIALASGHSVMMLKYSVFYIASPNACSAILWRNQDAWQESADKLCITSSKLLEFGAVDCVINEPDGGAHRFQEDAYANVKEAISEKLGELVELSKNQLDELQYRKFCKF